MLAAVTIIFTIILHILSTRYWHLFICVLAVLFPFCAYLFPFVVVGIFIISLQDCLTVC